MPEDAVATQPASTGGKHVLIIEDERALSRALQLKLGHEGFQTDVAPNGEDAVNVLGKQAYDLAIVDLVMPKLDGFGVLKFIKEKGITMPIIVLSNLSQEEDMARAKELGAKEFYIKSDTPIADLVSRVNALLGIPKPS